MDDEIKKQSSKAETKNENQEEQPEEHAGAAKALGKWQQLETKVAEEALFDELREAAAALDDIALEKDSESDSSRSNSVANASLGPQQEESKISAQKQKQKQDLLLRKQHQQLMKALQRKQQTHIRAQNINTSLPSAASLLQQQRASVSQQAVEAQGGKEDLPGHPG